MLIKKVHSLQFKTAMAVFIAVILGVAAYEGFGRTGDFIIGKTYMSQEKCDVREEMYLHKFEKFVSEDNIYSGDTSNVKEWCKSERYVYLLVYKGNKLYYETDGTFVQTYDIEESETASEDLYPVRFSDGAYGISIIEFSESRYYEMVHIAALAVSILLFIAIILMYNSRIINKIIALSNDVRAVRDGDLKREIVPCGNDELTRLQYDINDMRKSITRHYEGEKEALKANNELLTSISHDIRTPLTSLMVYADALADGQIEDHDEVIRYASICRDKAYQLKDLTDTLFKYFLVYGKQSVDVKKEEYDAPVLFSQLLGERIIFLQQKGYIIRSQRLDTECRIETDAGMMNRVFDNVFSNLEKYADKSRVITVSGEIAGSLLKIEIKNYISASTKQAESTKIGLKTSERIMDILGGEFKYLRNKDSFTVQVIMPVLNK